MCGKHRNCWIKASNSCQMNSFSRYVPNVFAARAVDQQHRAKDGMHSGLMTSPCVMIVPNSLLKVLIVVILYSTSFLSCLGLNQPLRVGRGLARHLSLAWFRQQCRLVMVEPESARNSSGFYKIPFCLQEIFVLSVTNATMMMTTRARWCSVGNVTAGSTPNVKTFLVRKCSSPQYWRTWGSD